MESLSTAARAIKFQLLSRCNYKSNLVQENYQFSEKNSVRLAAFAHQPFDARSACIAVIDSQSSDPRTEVLDSRGLGAPVVFACGKNGVQIWKPGQVGATCTETLQESDLVGFFDRNQHNLTPSRIYDAKTLGRIPGSSKQLDFVDIGLLPFVEHQIGDKLTAKVSEAIDTLRAASSTPESEDNRDWVCKAAFRLLAAKILHDKQVKSFRSIDFSDLTDLFSRVHEHYGSLEAVSIGRNKQEALALQSVAQRFQQLSSLKNLTTEALADVYENAFITKYTRKLRGTHSTPSYLVDYIVWQLAPWISSMRPEALRIFEPACGHAPFLVSAMRLLRTLNVKPTAAAQSAFFRERLCGIESDPFALEIARLSLTVADVPNPNGWRGLAAGDMFAGKTLESNARISTILLANPPFEGGKALRLLERTIPHLPGGAVFGAIAPAALLFKKTGPASALREVLLRNFQIAETCLFPDNIFEFADQECLVLIGKRINGDKVPLTSLTRCRRVREEDTSIFTSEYQFKPGQDRLVRQARFSSNPNHVLWVEELDEEVWSWLKKHPTLESLADLGQGIAYKSKPEGKEARARFKTNESSAFAGSIKGFGRNSGDWAIHDQPELRHLSLDKNRIRRPGTGTTREIPQVIIKRNPIRGAWRMKAFIDSEGKPIASNFISVRPHDTESFPLEYLWALCNSPLASAYTYTHSLKRNIQDGDLRQMPVPHAARYQVVRVAEAARAYREAARLLEKRPPAGRGENLSLQFDHAVPTSIKTHTAASVRTLLVRMDAEVLRLYDLPAKAERALLELFEGRSRPGLPIEFKRYPSLENSAPVPLYAYISSSFQRKVHGEPAVPSEGELGRYNELYDRSSSTDLSDEEQNELYGLQAEIDGHDYAEQPINHNWDSPIKKEQVSAKVELSQIAELTFSKIDPRSLH